MARSPTSPATRLKKLRQARDRVWACSRGEVLTSKPMAKLLGVTWNTLRDWCDDIDGFEQSGAFERGAQGIDYEFCPVRTIWFLLDYFEAEVGRRSEKTRGGAAESGVQLADDDDNVDSWEEVRGRTNLSITVTSAQEKQGRTCETTKVKGLFSAAFEGWKDAVMGIKTNMDPNGQMTAAQRDELDQFLRVACATAKDGAIKAMKDFDAGLEQAGVAGAV